MKLFRYRGRIVSICAPAAQLDNARVLYLLAPFDQSKPYSAANETPYRSIPEVIAAIDKQPGTVDALPVVDFDAECCEALRLLNRHDRETLINLSRG